MRKNYFYTYKSTIAAIALSLLFCGCAKEVEQQQPQEELHEVVFHAGWAPETKTVLQDDGSVWWSPEDEISLFVGEGNNGGYKLTSTNDEPSATTDFVGNIRKKSSTETYTAIYPYNDANMVTENAVVAIIPSAQIAKENTFEKNLFASVAVSDDENLSFKNISSGVKFSVSNPGITKIEISSANGIHISGSMWYRLDQSNQGDMNLGNSTVVTIVAPSETGFEIGKYYYAIVAPNKFQNGVIIRYYKNDKVATLLKGQPIVFKEGTFKRLYAQDSGLEFKDVHSKAALSGNIFPYETDKSTITEIIFHVNSDKTTDDYISYGYNGYEIVYREQIGSVMHFYTCADKYEIRDASTMFRYCSSLKQLDLSSWDTSVCSNMRELFNGCHSLETLDLSGFNTANVKDMANMFNDCYSLKSINIENFDTSNVGDMMSMFGNCWLLENIDLTKFKTGKVENMGYMFSNCKSLKMADMSHCDFESLVRAEDMFFNCYSLKDVDFPYTSSPKLTHMSSMFWKCYSLNKVSFNGLTTNNVESFQYLFGDCSALKSLDLSNFDTSKATSLYGMFIGCTNLSKLDLSNFNTTEVADIDFIFSGCRSIVELDLSSFKTDKLNYMHGSFDSMDMLSKVNLGTWDLSSIDLSYSSINTLGSSVNKCHIKCSDETKSKIFNSWENIESNPHYVWYGSGETLPEQIDNRIPGYYYSTDYSKDKTVRIKQKASDGNGIDIVIMGDGYSDRLIKDGTYDKAMDNVIDALFTAEPFKSFQHLFNVYVVYVVSENEVLGANTALKTYDNHSSFAGTIGSNSTGYIKAMSRIASNKSDSREIATIVVLNSETSDGAAWGEIQTRNPYEDDPYWDDYHGGEEIAFISGPFSSLVKYMAVHEFGHSFGMLADEYTKGLGNITDATKNIWQDSCNYGMYKNIDFTGDKQSVKWKHFLDDQRYSASGLGCFEGGSYYDYGVWRASEDSIMNSNLDGQFNAPSREAIYYRIHKLAYGKDWQYNFEDFVQWDLKNIQSESKTSTQSVPFPARVNDRKPFFKMEKIRDNDGGEMIRMIMN